MLVPDAENRIGLRLLGPACYLGAENGDPVDITPHGKPWRRVFAGLARAFYAGKDGEDGAVEVVALGVLGQRYFSDSTTVTIVSERVALRGTLSSQPFEVRYTTDGSEPKPSSALYTGPLTLSQTTTVRAASFSDGKMIAASSGVFTKGARPVSVVHAAPGGEKGAAEDPSQKKGGGKKKKTKP